MAEAWVHLHLPRLKSGDENMISYKIPGKKIEYVNTVILDRARFVVNQKGRERTLSEGVRNVHAWVVGEPFQAHSQSLQGQFLTVKGCERAGMRRAIYDPWKGDSFVDSETLEPVQEALTVVCVGKVVLYRPYTKEGN